jgi:hypothetical protein
MPSSATSVSPSALTSSAKACRSGAASSIASLIVSHPRRSAISGVPSGPHSVASLPQTRLATCSEPACLTFSTMPGSSSSGIEARIVGGRFVTTASRRSSTPSINPSIASSNSPMPSTSSVWVTSVRSIPASASAASSRDGSWSAVGPVISDFSAAASSVGIGIVFTVSGATSSSTYLVSL